MQTTTEDLRLVALAEFTAAGYSATSLQRIAELADVSKSSVLYHFSSKEDLLQAAVTPAVDRLAEILELLAGDFFTPERRTAFLAEFIDFLLIYRREVNIFINQGPSLFDVPVIERATILVRQLAEFFHSSTSTLEDRMRFAIALGGAAYMLCSQDSLGFPTPVDETRAALLSVLTELLAPVATLPSPVQE